ncbi:MAG TPA: hypothetical protein VJ870_00200 [Amycolatopsis sp.]|nr:hypothetical protein [Amycolatopsis sp.]
MVDAVHRDALARQLLRVLAAACPDSRTRLRGSLATGQADAFSDIDITWRVPDDAFDDVVAGVADVLEKVWPVALVREDPEWQKSEQRRLVFVAFRDLPLFWRLDLDVRAESCPANAAPAPGEDWSPAASALANAVAAVKAVLRDQPGVAVGLLDRAFQRVEAEDKATGQWREDVTRLAEAAVRVDPGVRPLAGQVVDLAGDFLY